MRKACFALIVCILDTPAYADGSAIHSSVGIGVDAGYRTADSISVIDWGIAASYSLGGEVWEEISLYGKAGFLFDAPVKTFEPFLSFKPAYGLLLAFGAMFHVDPWLFEAEAGLVLSWMNSYPIVEFMAGGAVKYRFASMSETMLRVPISFSVLIPLRIRFSGNSFGATAGIGISVEIGTYA